MDSERFFRYPTAIAIGAIGEVGNRVFVVQVRDPSDRVTLKLEKAQVGGLIQFITRLLEEIDHIGHMPDKFLIEPPLEQEFSVGEISVALLEEDESVMLRFTELTEEEPRVVTVQISNSLAATLAIQGTELIEQGRPTCPLCGYVIEPEGHPCPKTNGYRPPTM